MCDLWTCSLLVLSWYCCSLYKKYCIFSSFRWNINLYSPRLKQWLKKKRGNEIYIIIMHDFNHIPRLIPTNHIWLHNSRCSLQRRTVLGWPFQHMKTKRSFLLGSLWRAMTDRTEGLKTEVPVTECTLTEGQWPLPHQFAHSLARLLWERLICFLLGGSHCYLPFTSFIDTTLSIIFSRWFGKNHGWYHCEISHRRKIVWYVGLE